MCVRGAPEVCRVGETSTEFTSFIAPMQFLCMESYKFMYVASSSMHTYFISKALKLFYKEI